MLLLTCAGVQQFPALSAAIYLRNLLPPAPALLQSQEELGSFWVTGGESGLPGYRTKRKLGFLPAASGKTYLFDGSQGHLKPSPGFMPGYGSFCLFPKCSAPKWGLSMWVKYFSREDPIAPRHHMCCVLFQVSNRKLSSGLCEASKSHLTAEKQAQKKNATFFFQNKNVQPSCVLRNMMEMFSFSSRARKHQVFGTLKEAVKLN